MDAPVPMSFPALLRTGLASRYAHLAEPSADRSAPVKKYKSSRRVDNNGKRWTRRKENARFTGNVHIVQPSQHDLLPSHTAHIRSTFPEPLPGYLPRENKAPNAVLPQTDACADSGRFSMSLKGMRRSLRAMSFRSQALVRDVEHEINAWLEGGTMLFPNQNPEGNAEGRPIGETGIIELSSTPLALQWRINDAFVRYVVHATARYHNIVSYSKDTSGERITFLLRPNVAMPSFNANAGLETPPVTDLDLSSQLDSDSEFASDPDIRSEVGGDVDRMSTIREDAVASPPPLSEDEWSVVDENESNLAQSVESLDPDATLVVERRFAAMSLRSRAALPQIRSSSSPSRSPVRPRSRFLLQQSSPTKRHTPRSFYEFLFS
ncbi:Methyltransf-25 domain-containing protein [Mycena kentingensis (nom. inval.)]|nr:Methyltransf-25 domain-containing protein [Mycena kentingensis (nom. inval.)]